VINESLVLVDFFIHKRLKVLSSKRFILAARHAFRSTFQPLRQPLQGSF